MSVAGCDLPCGGSAEHSDQSVTVDLDPGDLVILTSDGVVEANAPTDHLFGFDRLE